MKNSAFNCQSLRFETSERFIRHVLLDSGGVLYDDSAWKRWLLGLLSHMGLHTRYAAFFRVWDREFQPDVWEGKCDFASALRRFLHTAGLTSAQVDEILASTRPKLRAFEAGVRLYPGVRTTVNRLGSDGADLSVVSRIPGQLPEIASCLSRLGLGTRLQNIVVTADLSLRDDASVYYGWAASQSRWPSHEVAYVGRDPAELRGAAQAGLMTIAFNYDADAEADWYIDQFDQLVSLCCRAGTPLRAAG